MSAGSESLWTILYGFLLAMRSGFGCDERSRAHAGDRDLRSMLRAECPRSVICAE